MHFANAFYKLKSAANIFQNESHIDIRSHPSDAPRYQWILPRAKKCPPDTFYTSLWTGAALSNPLGGKKADTRMGICFFDYRRGLEDQM